MEGNPLLRFYIDNKKHLPGLLVIVGISLLSGVLKMLSATYWGKAVDFGVAGLVEEMIFSAVFMAVFILLDCARSRGSERRYGKPCFWRCGAVPLKR